MLDFDTAMQQQENLDELCARRPMDVPEVFWPNCNYGHSRLLKEYAGYPMDMPIMAVIPHGVYMAPGSSPGKDEIAAPVASILSYPAYLDNIWLRSSRFTVVPSASPFLYARALLEDAPAQPREGTLFFPRHSTDCVRFQVEYERVAEELEALPDEYHPITVCAHFFDYQQGWMKPFVDHGMRIVSAGHLNDRDFLIRLAHLMSAARFTAGNALGSSTFYAVAAGLPFLLMAEDYELEIRHGFETPTPSDSQMSRVEEYRRMFRERVSEPTPEQREASDYCLGRARFQSPSGLMMDLQNVHRLAVQNPTVVRRIQQAVAQGPPQG